MEEETLITKGKLQKLKEVKIILYYKLKLSLVKMSIQLKLRRPCYTEECSGVLPLGSTKEKLRDD